VGSLHFVAVHPDYQGQGLARVVVGHALACLRTAGYTWAWLTTQTTSARAVHMYLRLGFVPYLRAASSESDFRGWSIMAHLLGQPLEMLLGQPSTQGEAPATE